MTKYSILMPYYRRASQLWNTLVSFRHHYNHRRDYEVIIIVEPKGGDDLSETQQQFFDLPIAILIFPRMDCSNPAPLYNFGFAKASGKFIVLTSPECFHQSDVLAGLDQEFAGDEACYVICACQSLLSCPTRITSFGDFSGKFQMWYQHSVHRNECFHFCTALSREHFERIGGFDEAYAFGIAYDDNDLRDRISEAGIRFVMRDDLVVAHQEHERQHQILSRAEYIAKLTRNRQLYESRTTNKGAHYVTHQR